MERGVGLDKEESLTGRANACFQDPKGVCGELFVEIAKSDGSRLRWPADHNWMITCRDPNGIFIELQQYTDNSMQLVGGVCEVDYEP